MLLIVNKAIKRLIKVIFLKLVFNILVFGSDKINCFNEIIKLNLELGKGNHMMLNYVKMILTKVSFDKVLFEKELSKAVEKLNVHDLLELKTWCYTNFSESDIEILEELFTDF